MRAGDSIQFVVAGETLEGVERIYTFTLPLAEGKTGKERFNNTGLQLDDMFGDMEVAIVIPGLSFDNGINKQVESIKLAGVDSGWIVESVQVRRETTPKQIVFIPALLLLAAVGRAQWRRRKDIKSIISKE